MVRRRTSRDRANWLRCSERHLRTARCIHTAGELWFVDSWGARVLHAWALAHLGGRPVSVPQWGKVVLAVSGIAAKCSAGDVSDVKKHLAELVETAMRSPLSTMITSGQFERLCCVQHLAFLCSASSIPRGSWRVRLSLLHTQMWGRGACMGCAWEGRGRGIGHVTKALFTCSLMLRAHFWQGMSVFFVCSRNWCRTGDTLFVKAIEVTGGAVCCCILRVFLFLTFCSGCSPY